MKKISYLLIAAFVTSVISCGDGTNTETTEGSTTEESTESTANTEGFVDYDLSAHGMNLTIQIPGDKTGVAEVLENEFGGVDVMVGKNFAISIAFGEGDMALVKEDLNSDPVYKSTVLTEEDNLLIYERSIPDAGIEPEHHFFYTVTVGEDIYDVRNMVIDPFSAEAVDVMVASAKTLKTK